MSRYSILSTVGVEYETECIPQSRGNTPNNRWSIAHDASIESRGYIDNEGLIVDNSSLGQQTILGAEYVSIPFTEEYDVKKEIETLIRYLIRAGEREKSFRAGIHIHICFPYNLECIKNILILGAHLEQVMFNIGTMGYEFRGSKVNNSAYCRPITKFGPQVVFNNDGKPIQIHNINDLLKSKTVKGFFNRYGYLDIEGSQGHYHASRYCWLNFHSLLVHNTIEFRIFNKTFNTCWIMSAIELCQKMCEYAVQNPLLSQNDFPENSIYDDYSKESAIETLRNFAKLANLNPQTLETLERIIMKGQKVTFRDRYVYSHLDRNNGYFSGGDYHPPIIDASNYVIDEANIVTIHTLG